MKRVIFGLGANLGRPVEQLASAVRALGETVEIDRVSSIYLTAPVGYADQPDFHNIVVLARADAPPEVLLAEALRVERELGRERTFRNAPRSIDIDLLDVAGEPYSSSTLTLPHPRLHERAFVLVPLAEVAPEWRHPTLDLTVRELIERLPHSGRIERVGPLDPRR